MNLVEAFYELGPRDADDKSLDRLRQKAAVQVYEALSELALGLKTSHDYRDEAVNMTILKLIQGGYRLEQDHPAPVGQVRRYLRTALKRTFLDLLRRDKRELPSVEVEDAADCSESLPADQIGQVVSAIDELCRRVSESLRRDGAANLMHAVTEMKGIKLGQTTFDALVAAEKKGGRSAVHQRHCRARKRMLAWVASETKADRLSDEKAALYDAVVAFLRTRQPMTSTNPGAKNVEGVE